MSQREIKFRAWDLINKVMYENIHLSDRLNEYLARPKEYTPMQYTGLKDGDDYLDWWEGDLIELDGGSSGVHEIKWEEEGGCFVAGSTVLGNVLADYTCKKVGNIHENPELLKA